MTSAEVRKSLVDAIRLDLVGPGEGPGNEAEVLAEPPSRWYLTGFLVPTEASAEQRSDEAGADELAQTSDGRGDDNSAPEPAAARRSYFPSAIGMSFFVAAGVKKLVVTARWGDYEPIRPDPTRRSDVKPRSLEAGTASRADRGDAPLRDRSAARDRGAREQGTDAGHVDPRRSRRERGRRVAEGDAVGVVVPRQPAEACRRRGARRRLRLSGPARGRMHRGVRRPAQSAVAPERGLGRIALRRAVPRCLRIRRRPQHRDRRRRRRRKVPDAADGMDSLGRGGACRPPPRSRGSSC